MNKLFLLAVSAVLTIALQAQQYELKSPEGTLEVAVVVNQGIEVTLKKQYLPAVQLSNISMVTTQGITNNTDWRVQRTVRNSVNETVSPEIREKAEVLSNAYNELEIRFRSGNALTFRLFDEGLAYRFSTSSRDSLTIYRENLHITFDEGDSVRYQSSGSFNSSYETPYEHKIISGIEKGKLLCLPLLVEKQNGLKVMVAEADLYNYPALWLNSSGNPDFSATHAKYPDKLTSSGSIYSHYQVAITHDYIARVRGTRTYPWRLFAVTDHEAGLVENNLVYLLATPNALDDISWIKPGVVMFDWWAKNNIYGVNFKSGINTETAKYFIDFCAEYGFRYFLFDDGWSPLDNLLRPVDGLNMEEVTAYAASKGVDVMLWVIWHALEKQWDQAFDLFEKWGIKGIKMDFMNRDDQPMVEFYEAVARKAAEKKMVVNYHGAYTPRGLRRKYPNFLTREGLIEFEYNGWTNHANPQHHNLLPYIRMFSGPMDYIPGTVRNSTKDNFRPVSDYPMGIGTRAHAMALWVVLNSPMTMLPDSPSDYYREKECTEFLSQLPVVWDETRLLKGKIEKYTVMARRSGKDWYIGAITNYDARKLQVSADFLPPGKYQMEIIEDGINADKRAEDYIKTKKQITSGDPLEISLAPGGGWIARIFPLEN
jgi:alpha-glucosidase